MLTELLNSKKFVASILASLLALGGLYMGLPVEQVLAVIAPLASYTVAQGVADLGKERAKIEAANGHNNQ